MSVTQWFLADVCPEHTGVYEVKMDYGSTLFRYWDGFFWSSLATSVDSAYLNRYIATKYRALPWRGIAI